MLDDVVFLSQVSRRLPFCVKANWKDFTAFFIIWNSATLCVRLCALLFYVRLFGVSCIQLFRTILTLRWIYYILMDFSTILWLFVLLGTVLICQPIEYSLDKSIHDGHCGDVAAFKQYVAVINMIVGIFITILPLPHLLSPTRPMRQRIFICGVIGMGLL
jgi:hypothetical protein